MSRRLVLVLLLLVAAEAGAAEAIGWGWLGVRIRDLTEQEMNEISLRHGIREGFGVLIVEVLAESPAARAGMRNGDVVVAFKSHPVTDARSLQRLVAATPAGAEVGLTVLRAEQGRHRLAVSVGSMPREVVGERIAAEFGFVVREPSEERRGLAVRSASGPVVVFVLRGSQADRAGLRPGDVIVEVNGRPALSGQAVSDALAEAALDQPLGLSVRRGEEQMRLMVGPALQERR